MPAEPKKPKSSVSKLNRLRASVLGANDGIVSISALIVGVAGATTDRGAIFTAGLAGLVAGALSMAVGEYVSVSSQSDSEKAYIASEKRRLKDHAAEELEELAAIYQAKGLSVETSHKVARELTEKDALKAHLSAEFNLDEDDLNSPMQAAIASLLAFTVGGIIPLSAMMIGGTNVRIALTFAAVGVALTITGYASATVGGASRRRAILRVVSGGVLAMILTFAVGWLFGTQVS